MPIVGFLNCGPTCKANSNARPQTDLRFARTPTIILTRKAKPKKTRTTRIHFTTPISWISAFSMHSLLICGGSILRASFFFECKEVDVSRTKIHLDTSISMSSIAFVVIFFGLAFLVKIIVGVHAKRRSVWGRALELALQVGLQLRKPTIGKPPPRPPRDG